MIELSKFSLKPIDHMVFSNSHAHEASSSSAPEQNHGIQIQFGSFLATDKLPPVIEESSSLSSMEKYARQAQLEDVRDTEFLRLGSFNCPINRSYPHPPQCFLKSAFKYAPAHSHWPPCLSAHYKMDWAQAGYTEEDIDLIDKNWAVLCSRCLQWGHQKIHCPPRVICIHCSTPDHKARNCSARIPIDYYGPNMVVNPPTINLSNFLRPLRCTARNPLLNPTFGVRLVGTMATWRNLVDGSGGSNDGNGFPKSRLMPRIPLRFPLLLDFLNRHRPLPASRQLCRSRHPRRSPSAPPPWRTTPSMSSLTSHRA